MLPTAGDDEQETPEEMIAIADSENQNDQEELSPIESVKNAIALLVKHSNHILDIRMTQIVLNRSWLDRG